MQLAATDPARADGTAINKIKLNGYEVGESMILADLAMLFSATDLSADSACHSGGDACLAIFARYGVKFSDGKPLSTQSF